MSFDVHRVLSNREFRVNLLQSTPVIFNDLSESKSVVAEVFFFSLGLSPAQWPPQCPHDLQYWIDGNVLGFGKGLLAFFLPPCSQSWADSASFCVPYFGQALYLLVGEFGVSYFIRVSFLFIFLKYVWAEGLWEIISVLNTLARYSRRIGVICSVWRYIDGGVCGGVPPYCQRCDRENSSFHVLFECPFFSSERCEFRMRTSGHDFCFEKLEIYDRAVCRELVRTGKIIFKRLASIWVMIGLLLLYGWFYFECQPIHLFNSSRGQLTFILIRASCVIWEMGCTRCSLGRFLLSFHGAGVD